MSSFWMKCPNCGKRFEVRRTAERVTTKREVVTIDKPESMMSETIPRGIPASLGDVQVDLPDDVETLPAEKVTTEERYACLNCGFTWSVEDDELKDERGHPIREGKEVSEGPP